MSGLGRLIAEQQLRSDATMRAAQDRWDNMSPPEPDEDEFTEQEAREQAADEIAANPASIMFHLGHMVGDAADSVPVSLLVSDDFDPAEHVPATLLAVMFEGTKENREAARYELRDRLATRMQRDIAERAAELLAEHAARDA
jgi:hypothetical protein